MIGDRAETVWKFGGGSETFVAEQFLTEVRYDEPAARRSAVRDMKFRLFMMLFDGGDWSNPAFKHDRTYVISLHEDWQRRYEAGYPVHVVRLTCRIHEPPYARHYTPYLSERTGLIRVTNTTPRRYRLMNRFRRWWRGTGLWKKTI